MADTPSPEENDDRVTSELVLAARAAQELEPAVSEFVEATGLRDPVRELAGWLAELIHYRRAESKARLLMRAAEKIRASGLPPRAVSDRLLRAVLEDGALDDDPEMQERWANLLAHEATVEAVPPAFPEILKQLEPIEARLVDAAVAQGGFEHAPPIPFSIHGQDEWRELEWRHLDNLERLQLLGYGVHGPINVHIRDRPVEEPMLEMNEWPLGIALVHACAAPSS